jgi:hypothetical protein
VRNSVNDLKNQAKPIIDQVQLYADNRRRRLQTALEVTTAQVDALKAELQDLTPAGQLTALVERQGRRDSPYRAQLSLMTQVREDFEQMARLLATASQQPLTEPDVDPAGDELPQIERIVVYIDDLDRCPPDRVIQVLEAVQLLLAVPLFVVVVAVDPRWLLRSLTVHYKELFAADGPAAAGIEDWGSTPMQYLEKIFQIPFTLPAVGHTGYTTMVEALTVPAPHAEPSPSPVGPAGDSLQQIRQRLAKPTAAPYRNASRRAWAFLPGWLRRGRDAPRLSPLPAQSSG